MCTIQNQSLTKDLFVTQDICSSIFLLIEKDLDKVQEIYPLPERTLITQKGYLFLTHKICFSVNVAYYIHLKYVELRQNTSHCFKNKSYLSNKFQRL